MPNLTNILAAVGTICTADGVAITKGTFSIRAVDIFGDPIPFRIGGNKQATTRPVTWTITAGGLPTSNPTPQIATPVATDRHNIRYQITIRDTSASPAVTTIYDGVEIAPDVSGNWDFAQMFTGGSAASSIVLRDTVMRVPVSLFVASGNLVVGLGGTAPGANPVLLDTVTSAPFTLSIDAYQWNVTPGGSGGVASLQLQDLLTGTVYTLTVVSGELDLV